VRGSDVDDGAATIEHVRQDLASEPPHALEVDTHGPLPVLLGQLQRVLGDEDARVVDEDVRRAVGLDGAGYQRLDALAVGDIGTHREGPATNRADGLHALLRDRFRALGHHHTCALAREA